ncbi:MAG: xanthine dehydrogenase small subunit [Cytophagales bacterium]|nr:xanthine dehydrogenase small subunit [Cytophagales bacterium]
MTQVTNTVRFVLDGQIQEAVGVRRTTTVLDYVRESLHRTGTKEGCAEGDCGACVVLVGELAADGKTIHYIPTNSCMQLLPSIDGKSLKTVESLQSKDGKLHPVQEAMVTCHGSQCGFCTPGIVMSLAGLSDTHAKCGTCPSRTQINDALQGNLCRCTGYKPIVDAALQAAPTLIADATEAELLKQIKRPEHATVGLDGQTVIQPVLRTKKGNEFVSPATIDEVAEYLLAHPKATLLAGSTEIGLQVNKQFSRPDHIVYLGNVAELRAIKESATHWTLGAAVSLTAVESLVATAYPDFAEVLRRFGSPPIRATATLAGNIANGSPIGDSMPCLMALDATLVLRKGAATRKVSINAFYTGMKQNVLQSGEFIAAIELAKPNTGVAFRAHKVSKRFDQDISATCCAMSFDIKNDKFVSVRVAYNGLSPYPMRAAKIEAAIEGKSFSQITNDLIDDAIAQSFTPRDGLRATWAYRSLVARNLVMQFLEESTSEVSA